MHRGPNTGANSVEGPAKEAGANIPLSFSNTPYHCHPRALTALSWLQFVGRAPWDAALPQPSSGNTPQALEEVKGDDIIAVEKSLES